MTVATQLMHELLLNQVLQTSYTLSPTAASMLGAKHHKLSQPMRTA